MLMFEKYKTEIIKQFAYAKENDTFGIFNNLTPAECRDYFALLYDNERLTEDDKSVMRSFFKTKEGENLKTAINNCKLSSFRPVISFLKQETESEHKVRINLAAILVDFKIRPFNRFSKEFALTTDLSNNLNNEEDNRIVTISSEKEKEKEKEDDEREPTEPILVITGKPEEPSKPKPSIVPPNPSWFQKYSISILIGTIILLTAIIGINYFTTEKECMAWMENQYEEVNCNILNENPNIIVIPKDEKLIENFKKIIPCDTTPYEKNGKACLWYGKSENGNEYEFFTFHGVHPETGKTLKEVTATIMNNYGKGPCQ